MERYKQIIDNWKEFKHTCQNKRIQTTIRKNNLKAGKNFEKQLEEEFSNFEQADWNSKIYRLPEEAKKPGKTLQHWRGEYYVQEESAAIPVTVLNPQPGEKILDMCAAPGGKTTQIADKINNDGKITANDVSSNRIQSLQVNTYRMGANSVKTTRYDARNLPENKYDKILVDAPCTGEGDKARRNFKPADQQEIQDIAELQKQLLEKAESMLTEEGTIVYSTCTINPIENEKVVQETIKNTELSLQEINISLNHQKGIRKYKEHEFDEKITKTVRIMPHHLNTGAIYIAKFTK